MQHGQAAWTERAARICSMDIAWTRGTDMRHGHAACTCSQKKQRGCACFHFKEMRHGHAARQQGFYMQRETCSIDMGIQHGNVVDPYLFFFFLGSGSESSSNLTFNFGSRSEPGLFVKHAFLNLTFPFSLYRKVTILFYKFIFYKMS
jgi:hypothetical protein